MFESKKMGGFYFIIQPFLEARAEVGVLKELETRKKPSEIF